MDDHIYIYIYRNNGVGEVDFVHLVGMHEQAGLYNREPHTTSPYFLFFSWGLGFPLCLVRIYSILLSLARYITSFCSLSQFQII
jgi:hypothetical protein